MNKERALIEAKKNTTRAETELAKADREYAYYKNDVDGEESRHYVISQQNYKSARERAKRTLLSMSEHGINEPSLKNRLRAVLEKCNRYN